MPQLPPGAERRRPVERHTPSVYLRDGKLHAQCRCGATLGGNRATDTTILTLDDLLTLSREHNSHINNPRGRF